MPRVEMTCLLCCSKESKILHTLNDLAFDLPGDFIFVQCKGCELINLTNRPGSQEILRYYPDNYEPFRAAIQDERSPFIRWARRRNILKKCACIEKHSLESPGNLLDIGCSTGIFLDAMQALRWNVLGIELNTKAAYYARQRFSLNVIEGQFPNVNIESHDFDTITLFDVIEHTYNPVETLQNANNLLRDQGIIVLTIPNWESIDRYIFGRAWIGFDAPRHFYAFPKLSLYRLFEKSNLQIVKIKCGFGGYYTFLASLNLWLNDKVKYSLVRRLIMGVLKFPGVRFLFQPIFSLTDMIGIGGTRIVIAIKGGEIK